MCHFRTPRPIRADPQLPREFRRDLWPYGVSAEWVEMPFLHACGPSLGGLGPKTGTM
jgi:hypothetical protein